MPARDWRPTVTKRHECRLEDDIDSFVPEARVREEFDVTAMTLYRWDHDRDLGFPPPITIRGRKYRSRKQLQEFKERQIKLAIVNRKAITGGKPPNQKSVA
jgi:hypothetical protein